YSKDLIKLSDNSLLQRKGEISFNDYWDYICVLADKYGVKYDSDANLNILAQVRESEKAIDFNKATEERKALIDVLSDKIDKNELEVLVLKSVDFKRGKISSSDFHTYLVKLADANSILSEGYGELIRFTEYIRMYESVDIVSIFSEIDALEGIIKQELFRNDRERDLDKLLGVAYLLRDLFQSKLNTTSYASLKSFVTDIRKSEFIDFIKENYKRHNLVHEGSFDIAAMFENIPDALEFYRLAEERNQAMFANTLKRMRENGQKVAALVTGGFHSEGLTDLFKEKKLSYLVVVPKFDKDAPERPYIAILTNKTEPYQEMLEKGDYLALYSCFAESKYITEELGIDELDTQALGLAISFGKKASPEFRDAYLENLKEQYSLQIEEGFITEAYRDCMMAIAEEFTRTMEVDEHRNRITMVVDLRTIKAVGQIYKFVMIKDVNTGELDVTLLKIGEQEYAQFKLGVAAKEAEEAGEKLVKAARRLKALGQKREEAIMELNENLRKEDYVQSIYSKVSHNIGEDGNVPQDELMKALRAKRLSPEIKAEDIEPQLTILRALISGIHSAGTPESKPEFFISDTDKDYLIQVIRGKGLCLTQSVILTAVLRVFGEKAELVGLWTSEVEFESGAVAEHYMVNTERWGEIDISAETRPIDIELPCKRSCEQHYKTASVSPTISVEIDRISREFKQKIAEDIQKAAEPEAALEVTSKEPVAVEIDLPAAKPIDATGEGKKPEAPFKPKIGPSRIARGLPFFIGAMLWSSGAYAYISQLSQEVVKGNIFESFIDYILQLTQSPVGVIAVAIIFLSIIMISIPIIRALYRKVLIWANKISGQIDYSKIMRERVEQIEKAIESAMPYASFEYQTNAAMHLASEGNNNAEILCGGGKTKTGIIATMLEVFNIRDAGLSDGIIRTSTHDSLSEKDAMEGALAYSQFGVSTSLIIKNKEGKDEAYELYIENNTVKRRSISVDEAFTKDVIYCLVDKLVHRTEAEALFTKNRVFLDRSWRWLADEGDVAFYFDLNNTFLISGGARKDALRRNSLRKLTERAIILGDKPLYDVKVDSVKNKLLSRNCLIDEDQRSIVFNRWAEKEFLRKVSALAVKSGIALTEKDNYLLLHFAKDALEAHCYYERGTQYKVESGEVELISKEEGTLQPGRELSGGLMNAIRAKEEVGLKEETLPSCQMPLHIFV
ncbi:MAG: preprotein translocase subunit SecA, partial [Candidatus Omnitrophica bacterium]|nr:preprotein translocase subunit SecA [Candidatus Omnitrophota bacterium]